MQNIIFSVYSNLGKPWLNRKDELIQNHKDYAELCNADYYCFEPASITNFIDLMFYKWSCAEYLCTRYDNFLYMDLDVIPKTNVSFFDVHDMDKICLHRTLRPKWKINLKQMMLIDNGIKGDNLICNTGVFGINKNSCPNLTERRYGLERLHREVDTDGLYKNNNEVYISYLIERDNLPFKEIGMQWNFILDKNFTKATDACYFLHYSNKDLWDENERA